MTRAARPVRRLGSLATLVWDTNWHPALIDAEGHPLRQWGGAAYSLASLSAVCPAGWVIEPIIKVGADLEEAAIQHLRGLPHIHVGEGIRIVPEPNNRVELRYRDAAHRSELLTGGVPPWSWEELEPVVATLDALYINFITGFELDLATMKRVRAAFGGPIYTDLHSLFLGVASDGERTPRALPDWAEWVGCFDAIQLNEAELNLLVGGRPLEEFLPDLLRRGPRVLAVTLAGKGVRYAAHRSLPADPLDWHQVGAGGAIQAGTIPAPLGELPGDPTGCGDVWGGGFVASTLSGLPLEASIERAQRLAAAKITHPGSRTLRTHLRHSVREPIGA